MLMSITVLLLGSCAAYFQTDGASSYRGRVGATMPQDTLIFHK